MRGVNYVHMMGFHPEERNFRLHATSELSWCSMVRTVGIIQPLVMCELSAANQPTGGA
jgi:hypothetical protein